MNPRIDLVVPSQKIAVRVFDTPTAQARANLKIVFLKLDHIGDFITAIGAFRLLRRAFAGAEITLICLPALVDIAQSTGLFDRVVGFAAEQDSSQLGKVPRIDSKDLFARFEALLAGPYFLAADFKHDVFSPYSLLDYIDADCRAGFARTTQKGLDILLPTMEWRTPFPALGNKNLAVHAETRMTLLAHSIIETLIEAPLDAELFQLPVNLRENPVYQALETSMRLKIGLSVGAGSELRQWPASHWKTLIKRLCKAHDVTLVFFGGASDKVETAALITEVPPDRIIDLTGALPLTHVPAYMNLLDGYIGCDTGLTHLAAKLEVPTLNIFAGISNVSVWRARGPKVKTVYAQVICAPCHLRFKKDCPNHNICMDVLKPEIIYDCFWQLMPSS